MMFDISILSPNGEGQSSWRTCTKCERPKLIESFGARSDTGRLKGWCNECNNTYAREWKAKTAYYRNGWRPTALKKYGLTPESYDALVAAQDGLCAICGRSERSKRTGEVIKLSIDHDHETGKVRGLLCGSCNRALGLLQENPVTLERMAEYLRTTASIPTIVFSKEA